jgi:protein-arginine kinase activator protein McsA
MLRKYFKGERSRRRLDCPECGKELGEISNDKYFCSECYLEFHYKHNKISSFVLTERGVALLRNKIHKDFYEKEKKVI